MESVCCTQVARFARDYTGPMAVVATAARFKVGDRVRMRDKNGTGRVWIVGSEDTNKTPVHDPEPAYHLIGSTYDRYAYDSDLEPA